MMKFTRRQLGFGSKGFTLIELLVGLMVTSVILTAVATLAFALGVANDNSRDTIEQQARLRYVTVKAGEILRYCKLVCGDPNDDLAVWVNDDKENEREQQFNVQARCSAAGYGVC